VELGNLPDQPLEGHLPNEQLSALLVLANFTGSEKLHREESGSFNLQIEGN